MNNRHLFEGKTVLDVGCGTGVLSIFAAKAGAAKVYGVDCADIAFKAREIVIENGLADKVTIIKGLVENIDLPVHKVDIIISEWMGYFLLYESMLDSVIVARDRWLKRGGLMFPDKCTLYLAGIEDTEYRENKIDFWDNIHGVSMQSIKRLALKEPIIDIVEPQQLATTACPIFKANIQTVKLHQTEFVSSYILKAERTDYIHAVIAWFDVEFTHGSEKLTLTTDPRGEYTHWRHSVFYIEKPIPLKADETIRGSIAMRKNDI